MENLFSLESIYNNIFLIIIILGRTSGLFIAAPVLSSRNIPGLLKLALIIIIGALIGNIIPLDIEVPNNLLLFIILFISEFIIGLIIGYTCQLLFAAIQLAGQSIDMQMGFGIVNVMDPQSGMQVPLIGTYKYLLAILIFFALNAHHWIIEGLVLSYKVIPVSGLNITGETISFLLKLTSQMFVIAFKLAAPLVGVLFITDFTMGIVARTVPQMNVFLVGMPAKIISGFFLMLVVIPLYIYLLTALIERCLKDMMQIFKVLT